MTTTLDRLRKLDAITRMSCGGDSKITTVLDVRYEIVDGSLIVRNTIRHTEDSHAASNIDEYIDNLIRSNLDSVRRQIVEHEEYLAQLNAIIQELEQHK